MLQFSDILMAGLGETTLKETAARHRQATS